MNVWEDIVVEEKEKCLPISIGIDWWMKEYQILWIFTRYICGMGNDINIFNCVSMIYWVKDILLVGERRFCSTNYWYQNKEREEEKHRWFLMWIFYKNAQVSKKTKINKLSETIDLHLCINRIGILD